MLFHNTIYLCDAINLNILQGPGEFHIIGALTFTVKALLLALSSVAAVREKGFERRRRLASPILSSSAESATTSLGFGRFFLPAFFGGCSAMI